MSAWDILYRRGVTAATGTPVAYAILDLKGELLYNDFDSGMNLTLPLFGNIMERDTRRFQEAHGLEVDGVIGPVTARALYERRFRYLEANYGVPDRLVCRVTRLESACDPGAVGVADPHDQGIVQINSLAHPDITRDRAFDATWSLDYLARTLHSNFMHFGDWDVAVAAWNVGGGGAQAWRDAGKPGHLTMFGFDLGARATEYVRLVRSREC